MTGVIRLFDIRKEAARQNQRYFQKLVSDNPGMGQSAWEVLVSDTLEEALRGADLVMISILPGSLRHMKIDVHLPERYGIYQSVGDTIGPGGFSRALRAIPLFRDFAKAIQAYCPDAWVVNYTNPMSMLVNTLVQSFPDIKVFGYCHEVFDSQRLYASILEQYFALDEAGKEAFLRGDLDLVKQKMKVMGKPFGKNGRWKGIDRHDVRIRVFGINHFTFIDEIIYQDKDVKEIVESWIRLFRIHNRHRLHAWLPPLWLAFRNWNNVKFELYERFGVFGAAGDRHLAEFLPETYLPLGQKRIHRFGFFLTPVWVRVIYDKIRTRQLKKDMSMRHKIALKRSDEDGVTQLIPLIGGPSIVTNVNRINRGQMIDLPIGTAVETNALLSFDSIHESKVETAIPKELKERLLLHATHQFDFVKHYLARNKAGLIDVFLSDPSVSRLGDQNGRKLFQKMLSANADALEDWLLS